MQDITKLCVNKRVIQSARYTNGQIDVCVYTYKNRIQKVP